MKRSARTAGPRIDPLGPPAARQGRVGGPGATMRAVWVDPDDTRPTAARRARTVNGHRTFCPLRRMAAMSGSAVTAAHIMAADRLRRIADLARLGYTGVVELIGSHRQPGPSAGPSLAALAQAGSAAELRRALARFTPAQTGMLSAIVLDGWSIQAWCLHHAGPDRVPSAAVEMGRLIAVLDILALHWSFEIETEQRMDLALPA
jgi:hypothetical protein